MASGKDRSTGRVYPRGGTRSAVAIANEQYSIIAACRAVGLELPEIPMGRSVKVHCPFGFQHVDMGHETAFRVYADTNTAFCFAGCGYFTPVWLISTATDKRPAEVAADLLAEIGYRPLDLLERFSTAEQDPAPDKASLRAALQMYCERTLPMWEELQFNAVVAFKLGKCLALLDRVVTSDDAWLWLSVAKQAMTKAYEENK